MSIKIITAAEATVNVTPFGSLTWYASHALGNSEHVTVGRCIINPGCANPVHTHPNCDEVLHVLQGSIRHSLGDETIEMTAGDTIVAPANVPHNAANIGEVDAVCLISFSTGDRQTENE